MDTPKLIADIERLTQEVRNTVQEMRKKPAIAASLDYVTIRAIVDDLSERMKELNKLKTEAQYSVLPSVFERDGATTMTLSCQLQGTGAVCSYQGMVTAGSYTLQVTAPGFQTARVAAMVTVTPAAEPCGCPSATLLPSTVTLSPAGGA